VNSGRACGGEEEGGGGGAGGRGDKYKGTNIQFEREIMLRTNRERKKDRERKG
jgi:hypothetical protein